MRISQALLERHVRLNPPLFLKDFFGFDLLRFDWEFVKYIWDFNKNNRVLNATRIAKSRHTKAIVLKNRKEVKRFLEKLN
jgi:hypothetical protein